MELRSLLIEAFKTQGYLIVNKKLIQKIGLMEAILLSTYIDRDSYYETKDHAYDNWFYITHQKLNEILNIKEFTIKSIKQNLLRLGLIEIKKAGLPAKEFIKINYDNLHKMLFIGNMHEGTEGLDPKKSEGQDPPKSEGHRNSIINTITYSKNRDNNNCVPQLCGTVTPQKNYENLLIRLVDIIKTRKNVSVSNTQLKEWTAQIKKLNTTDGIPIERIEKALNWYAKHHQDEYVPDIQSGHSLRKKFLSLESAIERDKSNAVKRTRKTGYQSGETLTYKKPIQI